MRSFLMMFSCITLLQAQAQDSLWIYLNELNNQGAHRKLIKEYQLAREESGILHKGEYLILYAGAFQNLNLADSAFYYYNEALKDFEHRNLAEEVAETNLIISDLLESQNNLESDHYSYFEKFWEYATSVGSPYLMGKGQNYLGRKTYLDSNPEIPLEHFRSAYVHFNSIDSIRLAIVNLMNMGAVHSNRIQDNDSARYYYFHALDLLHSKKRMPEYSNQYHDLLNNIGNSYRRSENLNEALRYYKMAETLQVKQYGNITKKILFGNMDLTYYYLGDFENAYNYLYKYDSIKDVINLAQQNSTISDIQEKYDNEKLRADNLEIEKRRLANRNWLIAASLALFLGAGIAILLQKNTIKKRQLAEQEVLLKHQRVENLLKEQELLSIDAMIEGQEKERQKVAGELHDDLGSLMATIKLHFDNAKVGTQDPALKNAQRLLEEAYQKIRGMAHSKNSGVMSDQGLLPAIKKMAMSISESNTLQVTVEDFGLGERMENSLELSIFRMVQELVANVIKHAEATKVNIQLTQHEDNLNIIVEDNGKGFDRSKLDKEKSGMGLTNIEKRVEHLEGNFTVDSVLGKGTSILIDIPV
ncbi:ATP-binding protein [Muricauda sp. 334s03]|uniref:Oxygen sensor histidine kinase NreB n=1 Tax=Flagellimonas yonaguniensis TaxID=3031325 RepID=A0ABT5Y0N8_9FLAO|nr:ATP-binding protein [[Muricauda] yonaguniensis]MDF0717004.1 ATP-binding protein [[Muricauda] yonaguniensis]